MLLFKNVNDGLLDELCLSYVASQTIQLWIGMEWSNVVTSGKIKLQKKKEITTVTMMVCYFLSFHHFPFIHTFYYLETCQCCLSKSTKPFMSIFRHYLPQLCCFFFIVVVTKRSTGPTHQSTDRPTSTCQRVNLDSMNES